MLTSACADPAPIQPMNSAEFFLRYVRRGAGVLSVAGQTKSWVDYPFNDTADALKLFERFRDTHSVYATMGTLRAGASHRRVRDIDSLCGFFLDLDCHGNDGEASDIGEASTALRRFCRHTKIPMPSYLVASGHGLHAHWTLIDPIPTADWERVAKKFKALTLALGLPADPTVTADSARVLRVPNSFNFRDTANPVEVELLPIPGDNNFNADEFERAVDDALAKEAGAVASAPPIDLSPTSKPLSGLGQVLATSASSDLAVLEDALSCVSPDVLRGNGLIIGPDGKPVPDYWFGVILAVRREYGDAGKEAVRCWSQQSPRYLDGSGFEHAWNQYDPAHPKPVTIASVFMLAKANGWRGKSATLTVSPPGGFDFKLLDRSAIMAQPPLRWRVKKLLPEVGIGAIYGPSGSGKSFLGFDLSISIALGVPWFGNRTVAAPVTYLILEGEAGLRNRVEAWEAHNRANIPQGFTAITQPFELADTAQVEALGAILPKGGVFIIDTLNRAAPGLDENSSQDMGRILAGMKRLQEITGGLVLVVHHTGKDASKGLRGHSSLHAALDGAIEVERTATGRCWSAVKVKDGEDGKLVPFMLHVIDLGNDADGDPITSCAVGPDTGAIFRRPPPSGANQKNALSAIRAMLSTATTVGHGGAGAQVPCITFDDAVAAAASALTGVEKKRRLQRAREAVQGVVNGGHLKRGLDAQQDEWVWL